MIWEMIDGVKYVSNWNSQLTTIINDEAMAYFNGEKPIDEVARLIQSRLSLYVNEQR
jgi:hypothetical protein